VVNAGDRLADAHDALAQASHRRYGVFRDRPAIETAEAQRRSAKDRVEVATQRHDDLQQRVSSLRAHGAARAAAVEAVDPERSRLSSDRSAIHDALEPLELTLEQTLSRVRAWGLDFDPVPAAQRHSRTPDQGLDLGIDL
jgi:chromosome segregation ATPase